MAKREGFDVKNLEKLNSVLIENFVNLQKAMTNLAIKFDSLSDQISKLLQLFEISAKNFAEKLAVSPVTPDLEKDKEFLEKLNKLLDQNKVIAKGLTLMEEKLRERLYGAQPMPLKPEIPAGFEKKKITGIEEGYLPSRLNTEI